MKTILIALLALSAPGCAAELVDLFPGPDSDDSDSDSPGDNTPLACAVGEWTVLGNTGTGSCYPILGIDIEHSVRFTQSSNGVRAQLVTGYDDDELATASYEETASGCNVGLEVSSRTTDYRVHYALSSNSVGNVHGYALVVSNIEGYECEQSYEVYGVHSE